MINKANALIPYSLGRLLYTLSEYFHQFLLNNLLIENIKNGTERVLRFGLGSVRNVINAGNEGNLIDTKK